MKVKLFPTISIARKRLIGQVLLFGLIEEVGLAGLTTGKSKLKFLIRG